MDSQLISTLVGAFFGALAAFSLENYRRERIKKKTNIRMANRVLFALVCYSNELLQYKRDIVIPGLETNFPSFEMNPTLSKSVKRPVIDANDLEFLIDLDEGQLLFDLMIEGERFFTLTKSIENRSEVHFESAQKLMAEANIGDNEAIQVDKFREIVGPQVFATLDGYTTFIVEDIEKTIESHRVMIKKFRGIIIKTYPGNKFIDMQSSSADA